MKICPRHSLKLNPTKTKYGTRYDCPAEGCDIMCWDGETSTPADKRTRYARQLAHAAFDVLWRGKGGRFALYKKLSAYLGISRNKTHIGMFDYDTCMKVIAFSKEENKDGQQTSGGVEGRGDSSRCQSI
jgi:hypothetical protein